VLKGARGEQGVVSAAGPISLKSSLVEEGQHFFVAYFYFYYTWNKSRIET